MTRFLHKLVAVLATAVWQCGASGFTEPTWTGTQVLTPASGAEISLSYLMDSSKLTIKLSAETDGWIGFGLAEDTSGSMIGADIVTAYVDGSGTVVEDRHVNWAPYDLDDLPGYFPTLDSEPSDWVLLDSSEVSGTTTVIMERALVTDDDDDRDITTGPTRIIFAHGGVDTVSYHGSKRGSAVVDFSASQAPVFTPPADSPNSLTLTNGDYAIPVQKTTYSCRSWNLENEITNLTNRHVTAVEMVLDPSSAIYVHHALLHICPSTNTDWTSAAECVSPTGTFCQTILYGWAVGGDALEFPAEAGFLLGTDPGDVQHVVLEIHYDNPSFVSGVTDDSGVRIHYTNEGDLRTHSASSVILGDPLVAFGSIASGAALRHYEGVCPGACTEARLSAPINVFGSFLHMHSYGRQIYTKRLGETGELNRIDFWNFEYQQITETNYVINPGDQLNTHCVFDTTTVGVSTDFGTGSEDEMCQDFLFYYPRVDNFGMCGNGIWFGTLSGADVQGFFGLGSCSGSLARNSGGTYSYDLCSASFSIFVEGVTFCGDFDLASMFLADGVSLDGDALEAFVFSPNTALSAAMLQQSDFYDGLGFLEPDFGTGVTPSHGVLSALPSIALLSAPLFLALLF